MATEAAPPSPDNASVVTAAAALICMASNAANSAHSANVGLDRGAALALSADAVANAEKNAQPISCDERRRAQRTPTGRMHSRDGMCTQPSGAHDYVPSA